MLLISPFTKCCKRSHGLETRSSGSPIFIFTSPSAGQPAQCVALNSCVTSTSGAYIVVGGSDKSLDIFIGLFIHNRI